MNEIIEYYENKNYTENILNDSQNYLFFQISESTENALNQKCQFILNHQKLDWKPLILEYKSNIHIFIKTFYFKKLS